MSANKSLPIMLIAAGVGIVALIFGLSGKASANNTPSTNPDPVNHPNAVIIGGIWRDNNYYFDPNSLTWKPLSTIPTETGVKVAFDQITPAYSFVSGKISINYMNIIVRGESNKIQPGDKVKLTHSDYNNKIGTVTKVSADAGIYFITISIPWNFLTFNNTHILDTNIPINPTAGQLIKIS